MASSRVAVALLGAIGSLGFSVVLWVAFGTPVVFLLVPFVPFVLGRRRASDRQPAYRLTRGISTALATGPA